MKKLIFVFLCAALIITTFIPTPAQAVYNGNFVLENPDVLTDEEVAVLNSKAADIYNSTGFNVCVLFTKDTGGADFFDYIVQKYNGAAGEENGILLAIDLGKNEVSFCPFGEAENIISEDNKDTLWALVDRAGTWYDGTAAYMDGVQKILSSEITEPESNENAAAYKRLVDGADLLIPDEEAKLAKTLDEISERLGCDIVIVTANTLGSKSPMEYADDYYDYNGYAESGALLLVSMEDRDWYISTKGECIQAITDAGREYMSKRFLNDLSAGRYYTAFNTFATSCDEFITQERRGNIYDTGNIPKSRKLDSNWILYAIVAGVVIAFIVTGSMKSQLKSVYFRSAANYVRHDSLKLTRANDIFLYSHIDRTKKADERSSGGGSRTHTSSSGSTHGGGGGKF